jgi:hypothetical protein
MICLALYGKVTILTDRLLHIVMYVMTSIVKINLYLEGRKEGLFFFFAYYIAHAADSHVNAFITNIANGWATSASL